MLLILFQPNVLAQKGQSLEIASQSGYDLGIIPISQIVHSQIGGDDGGLAGEDAVIDQGVEGGGGELTGHFRAQIVDDQKAYIKPIKSYYKIY